MKFPGSVQALNRLMPLVHANATPRVRVPCIHRKQLPIGRPVSPKYATAVQRGGKMLTAARAKSFLDSVFKKQVEELRMQSFGTVHNAHAAPDVHAHTFDLARTRCMRMTAQTCLHVQKH